MEPILEIHGLACARLSTNAVRAGPSTSLRFAQDDICGVGECRGPAYGSRQGPSTSLRFAHDDIRDGEGVGIKPG